MTKKKRVVVKIGTRLLTTDQNKIDLENLRQLSTQIAQIKKKYHLDICIVSSGAIICGSYFLNPSDKIREKQAAAAIGQPILCQEYANSFKEHDLLTAQILLTKDGLSNKTRRAHTLDTIETLLEHNIIPIINENDTVAVDEITFGDNDGLSCSVAKIIKADLLMLLTDTNGVYTDNPKTHPNATLIEHIDTITDDQIKTIQDNPNARGGMKSKLSAAKIASEAGIDVYIANGRKSDIMSKILSGQNGGTFVPKK